MIKKNRNAPDTKGAKGGEFCVVHPDGRITDVELHEPIQPGIDCEAEARVGNIGKKQARKIGLTEAEIRKAYADD